MLPPRGPTLRPLRALPALIRAAAGRNRSDGQSKNPDVAADGDVLDVLALDRKSLLEGELSAAVHLHRAGQSRLDRKPDGLTCRVTPSQLYLLRTWPNEAHVPLQDIQELRQLVEARSSQYPTDARHTRVSLELEHRFVERVERDEMTQARFCIPSHRSKLEHAKRPAIHARTRLRKEHWTTRVKHDEHRDQEEK